MSTFLVEIIRDSLADFQERVADEEAGACEFSDNQVASEGNRPANLATFRRLGAGTLLAPARFAGIGAGPPGEVPRWTGVVVIGAEVLAVSMYRSGQ